MSLAAAFASVLYAASPPIVHSAPDECVPVWFRPQQNRIGCAEGYEIQLWGVIPAISALDVSALDTRNVALVFKASAASIRADGAIDLKSAHALKCYSRDSGNTRLGQCFVASNHVFGPEDLACALIKLGFYKPSDFARDYYSMCQFRSGAAERG